MPRQGRPYDWQYERERRALLAQQLPCHLRLVCEGTVADSADHDPPLALHDHVAGSGCCRLMPACLPCQRHQGKEVAKRVRFGRRAPRPSRTW